MSNPKNSSAMKIMLQFGELNITPAVEERLDDLGFTPKSLAEEVSIHKSNLDGEPAIYVGTYRKYNGGSLRGLWLDLTTFADRDELVNFCEAIHADEDDPELYVQDLDCLPSGLDGDDLLLSDEKWEMIRQYQELCDRYEVDAVDAFVSAFDMESLDDFEDRYQGAYDTEEDFARYIVAECYDLDRMGDLASYIDYEAYARTLFFDYVLEDGYVFRS